MAQIFKVLNKKYRIIGSFDLRDDAIKFASDHNAYVLPFPGIRGFVVFEGSTSTMNKTVPVLSYTTKDPKVRSLFSLDYIKDMIKILNKKEIIRINMGNDRPMKLTRGSFGTETIFLLAPRIEDN